MADLRPAWRRAWRRAAVRLLLASAAGPAVAAAPPLVLSMDLPTHWVPGSALWAVWSLRNTGAQALRVASHVLAAPGPQFDELTLTVCRVGDVAADCQALVLQTGRAASFPVECLLGPGASLRHRVDLQPWLERAGIALAPGRYRWALAYDREAPAGGSEPRALPACDRVDPGDDADAGPTPPGEGGALPAAGTPARTRLPPWSGHLRAAPVRMTVDAAAR